jgi:predicted CopG family antitoxin
MPKEFKGNRSQEPMIIRTLSIPRDLWEEAKEKAGLMSLSAVIRRLLEKWIRGEIDLD